MDGSLYKYLLWRKQSGDMDEDNNDDALSEFGFIKPTIDRNKQTIVRKVVRKAVKEVLVEDGLSGYYADNYRCWPPPVFLLLITIIELSVFIYYAILMGNLSTTGPVPIDSPLIYRPDQRIQVWRFFTYIFLHAGWFHLVFNLVIQICVGLPLEMVHGSFRTSIIYISGVLAGMRHAVSAVLMAVSAALAVLMNVKTVRFPVTSELSLFTGSLGTSVFDQGVYLVGASGGVYALLSAHLANVLLNHAQMELGMLRVIGVLLVASCDVGVAIWDRYAAEPTPLPVSYIAHLMGALAGLCVGLIVLKNFDHKLSGSITWWVAVFVYLAFVAFVVLWNIFIVSPRPYIS